MQSCAVRKKVMDKMLCDRIGKDRIGCVVSQSKAGTRDVGQHFNYKRANMLSQEKIEAKVKEEAEQAGKKEEQDKEKEGQEEQEKKK